MVPVKEKAAVTDQRVRNCSAPPKAKVSDIYGTK